MPALHLNLFRAAFAHARWRGRREWVKWIDAVAPQEKGILAFPGDFIPDKPITVQVDQPHLLMVCSRERDRTHYKVLRLDPNGTLKSLGIKASRGPYDSSWHRQLIGAVNRELRALAAATPPPLAPSPAPAPTPVVPAPAAALDDAVAQLLAQLLKHDPVLRLEPRRLRGLLSDLTPEARLEVNLIVFAAEVGAGGEGPGTPDSIKLDRGVSRLVARYGTQPALAEWAVMAWLQALNGAH